MATDTLNAELLAVELYRDASRQGKSSLAQVKVPSWLQIGTAMRNDYRKAAYTLLDEHAVYRKPPVSIEIQDSHP